MDDLDGICEAQPSFFDLLLNALLQVFTEVRAIEFPTSKVGCKT